MGSTEVGRVRHYYACRMLGTRRFPQASQERAREGARAKHIGYVRHMRAEQETPNSVAAQ
jgi:hypothetical protein